jgi:hypothetical protein
MITPCFNYTELVLQCEGVKGYFALCFLFAKDLVLKYVLQGYYLL